jgi:hypothetical protein
VLDESRTARRTEGEGIVRTLPPAAIRTVVAAAVLALVMPGAAAVPGPDRRIPRSETLQLALRNGTEVDVDVAEPGFGPGDYNLKLSSVFQGATDVGQLTQHCTIMRLVMEPESDRESLIHCTIHLVLRKGQIVIAGTFDVFDTPPVLAVTGGTGRYQGVSGEVEETGVDGEDPLVELRLRYPRG